MPGINQRTCKNESRNNFEVVYNGRWTIVGGAGAPSTKTGGVGMTLTRSALGLYTLTLDATPAAIVSVVPAYVSNVGVISTLTLTATGATFRTGVYATPGTAADPAAGENISIKVVTLKSLVR